MAMVEDLADGDGYLAGFDFKTGNINLGDLVQAFEKEQELIHSLVECEAEFRKVKLEKARGTFSFEGKLGKLGEQLAQEAADNAASGYSAKYRDRARLVLKMAPYLNEAADAWIEKGKHLPLPAYDGQRRLVQIEEQKELRLRYNDRPLRELLELYESTPDDVRGGDVTRFIEDEHAAGWPTLKPQMDDAKVLQALTGAIRAREQARVSKERRDLKARIQAATSSIKMIWLREAIGDAVPAVRTMGAA